MQIDYDGGPDEGGTTLQEMLDAAATYDNPATEPPPDDSTAPPAAAAAADDNGPPPEGQRIDYGAGAYEQPPPPTIDTYQAPPAPGTDEHADHSPATYAIVTTSEALRGANMDPSDITAAVQAARQRFGLTLDDTASDVQSIVHLAGGDAALVTQATIDRFVNAKYPTWGAPTESHGGRGGDADINYDGIPDAIQAHVVAATTADTYDGAADWLTPAQIESLGHQTPTQPTRTTTGPAPTYQTTATGGGRGTGSAQPTSAAPTIRVQSGPGLQAPYDGSGAPTAAAAGSGLLLPAALALGLAKLVGMF